LQNIFFMGFSMDDDLSYNKERWNELAKSNVEYSRPWFELTEENARRAVDKFGLLGDLHGKKVLCLAGGGGQQSVAFSMLGADVTVFDFSEVQLQRDLEAAKHYKFDIKAILGDMRDLSMFYKEAFDIVWQGHSVNFIPDVLKVFEQVARVIQTGGVYHISCSNPYVQGVWEQHWNGEGYLLNQPYVNGKEIEYTNRFWDIDKDDGQKIKVEGPREYRHTMSTLINGLVEHGFEILHLWEETVKDTKPEVGSWEHFKSIAPPFLYWWARYNPDLNK